MSELAIFLNLKDRAILVVGATPAAFARADTAVKAGASVDLIDPEATSALRSGSYEVSEQLNLHDRLFKEDDLQGKSLVFVATDNEELSRSVGTWAQCKNIPVNVEGIPGLSSFTVPATVQRGPVQVAISAGGRLPALASYIKAIVEKALPASLGDIAIQAGNAREAVRAFIPNQIERRSFWDNLFATADKWVGATVKDIKDAASSSKKTPGRVALVGAGPGDSDLLTLKAQRLLASADVVLYDRLVSEDVLSHVGADAERIFVGKEQGNHGIGQKAIEKLLISNALSGKHVVRLKGGDPMLFARAGEEISALRQRDIQIDIVPGITALSGIAAASQIPLTDRKYSDGLTLITGQRRDGKNQDFSGLAGEGRTLAIYMGLKDVAESTQDILEDGVSASTPVAIIENGTRKDERRFYGRLDELPGLVALHDIQSPALIIIGDVVLQAADLSAPVHFAVAA